MHIKRHKMARGYSKKVFHKHSRVKAKNYMSPFRGGWRI